MMQPTRFQGKKNYYTYTHFLLLAPVIFLCVSITSCQKKETTTSHPLFFDKIFKKADSINTINPGQALTYIDSACNSFHDPTVKDLFQKYAAKGQIYLFMRRNAEAMLYADSMVWIIRDHIHDKEYETEYIKALQSKGFLLQREGNYHMALEYCYKARQVLEHTDSSCKQSRFTGMLGIIYYKQKKYREAINSAILGYHEVLSCPENHSKYVEVQGALDNIGIYYTAAGMPDSGIYYFNEAIHYINLTENKIPTVSFHNYMEMAKGIVYGNEGDAWLQKKNYDTAEKLYNRSIAINSHKGFDQHDAQLTAGKLAALYIQQQKYNDAAHSLTSLAASLDSVPNREARMKWYELMADIYAKTGKKDSAYNLMAPYIALRDSLNNERLPQVNVDKEYELIKDHYDLADMEKKNEMKGMYLLITLIISTLSIVIAGLLWLFWHRSRRTNRRMKKQNNELQFVVRSLEESQEENTRLMKVVAHDLRNPINSMISVADLMQDNEGLSEDDKEMLQLMRASGERSISMVDDLLNLNTAKEELKKEPADLKELLQYCIDMMQFKATEKQQRIVLDAETALLNVNKDKMWRVFNNLITNAIKFSPAHATITIRLYNTYDRAVIEVQDQGVGIPSKAKDTIFDMFTTAKRTGTSGEQSYGLGLSISKQIVEAHNGRITVESEEGKGSKFTIILPLQ